MGDRRRQGVENVYDAKECGAWSQRIEKEEVFSPRSPPTTHTQLAKSGTSHCPLQRVSQPVEQVQLVDDMTHPR
jgi:hypothetical protein